MKNLVFCLATLFLSIGCNLQSSNLSDVESFVKELKEESAETFESPDFGSEDIAELLEYSGETTIVSTFPRNPLSSFYQDEVHLGIYILWTIESIRMREIDDPAFYLFASLNPRLIRVSTGELEDQGFILSEVADAYTAWWNSGQEVEEKLQISPLEDLDLAWN